MPRPDIYKNILSSLRQQLLEKVAGLDQDKYVHDLNAYNNY